MNPVLLHIETSGKICSIAISYGDSIVSLQESTETFSHASEITLLIQKAMKASNTEWAELSAVVVCDGPGSYTGLRVGLSVAKGICYSLKIPLIAVNALEALAHFAQSNYPDCYYFPMIDARRMEVYMGGWDEHLVATESIGAVVLTEKIFESRDKKRVLVGSGAEKSKTIFTGDQFIFDSTRLSSMHLIKLGFAAFQNNKFVDVADHTPFYLKPPNITKPKKAKL